MAKGKAKQAQDKDKTKKQVTFLVVAIVIALPVWMWRLGMFESTKVPPPPANQARAENNSGQNAQAKQAQGRLETINGEVRRVVETPAPPRVELGKSADEVLEDYINSHPDKRAAITNLDLTTQQPLVQKQLSIQEARTQISKMEFEELEYRLRLKRLQEEGLESLEETSVSTQPNNLSGITAGQVNSEVVTAVETDEVELSDFALRGVTKSADSENYTILLRVNNRNLSVRSGERLFGNIEATVKQDRTVELCKRSRCITL